MGNSITTPTYRLVGVSDKPARNGRHVVTLTIENLADISQFPLTLDVSTLVRRSDQAVTAVVPRDVFREGIEAHAARCIRVTFSGRPKHIVNIKLDGKHVAGNAVWSGPMESDPYSTDEQIAPPNTWKINPGKPSL